ncbi:MAG: molybdopterin-dependent oxidoreductase [Steroidobacteraceae bacterium]
MTGIRTTCPYCGVGCGVLVTRNALGEIEVKGDPDHPANQGRLCSKGSALADTLDEDDRLLHPSIQGQRVSWDTALDHVAQGFNRIIAEHGPESVALYVSGQLLTEDYYVANKLMKGYIGTANIDTNSRLCMSSAVAGHKRAFGEDLVPICYDDLDSSDLIVLVGSNTAWCHPILFQRIEQARQGRPNLKLVVIDPRRTATCEGADLHLPIRAGTDVWLFNGLLAYLQRRGIVDADFIAKHTRDLQRTLLVADNTAGDLNAVAKTCRVDPDALEAFYELFARTERAITAFSQGVNQSSAGTDKVNSIINCHLITGRIGKPGMGPFSITGQPNAMGGREVGGLANMLAAHMELSEPAHRQTVQSFWDSPRMAEAPGLKAVDLFEAIHSGRIKAVWIMATNPVVSLPAADRVRAALKRCELVVVSDCVRNTDTNAFAHVLLPAQGWSEKDGTVTNSDRRISRQRRFQRAAGEAKPDWWIISEVAKRMGFGGFGFASAHEVFREHARLSGADNNGTRAFDISGLATLSSDEYEHLSPTQWPVPTRTHRGTERLFTDGRFFHPDGKARFVPTPPHSPVNTPDAEFPLVLNTGRIRDQWHTMTRTGKAARLSTHEPEPYVDMHPLDALSTGTRAGELVRVRTRHGSMVARLRTSGDLPRKMVFVPIHWNGMVSSDARVGALVNPIVDPISGEPELKHTPAHVAPFVVAWHGFILTRAPITTPDVTWWTRVQGREFVRYELAGRRAYGDWSTWARRIVGARTGNSDWLEFSDPAAGLYRGAWLVDDCLAACVFISRRPDLPSRTWLASLFDKSKLDDRERAGLLVGQSIDASANTGPTVCSCFGVGRNTICDAIKKFELKSAQAVGQKLRAGTNCGSCVSEIKKLIAEISPTPTLPRAAGEGG